MMGWQPYREKLYPTELPTNELRHRLARATAALLRSGGYWGAQLVSSRGGNTGGENRNLLIVDVDVGLGQRALVNPIQATERVGITFVRSDWLPSVYPLRADFPAKVPHLNLALAGEPGSLCLFDMPTEEALRITTPHVLLERIRVWLKETAYGRLHGDDQPLEPMFIDSGYAVVLPQDGIIGSFSVYDAFRVSDHQGHPVFLETVPASAGRPLSPTGMSAIILITKALPHARIRMLPQNVAELLECYDELGIDILGDLRAAFQKWSSNRALIPHLAQACILVIRTPIERSPGQIGGEAAKAFATLCPAEELAIKLGAVLRYEEHLAPPLTMSPPDTQELKTLQLQALDVRRPFSRSVAQAASGLSPDDRFQHRIALIGAGALGSQFALAAARMGIGIWTIIDPDHLMPHNLARHALTAQFAGAAKADAVAVEIQLLLGQDAASSIVAAVSDPAARKALFDADLIIDASASVSVARSLADTSLYHKPTVSIFLNPSGNDLAILREGENRDPRIDHVEMAYYWTLVNTSGLGSHLSNRGEAIYPSGGCRQPSVRISQAQVGTFASLAVKRVLQDQPTPERAIEIWRMSDDRIAAIRSAAPSCREITIDGWAISISEDVVRTIMAARTAAGSCETGGILVGVWDRVRERAYIVGNYPPPPDSVANSTSFVRGDEGVFRTLHTVETRTATNLTYIGEWHTHPAGYSSRPSADDGILLRWIGDVLLFLDVPPLMLIAGHDGLRVLMGLNGQSVLLTDELLAD
jgi:hypothetical protein